MLYKLFCLLFIFYSLHSSAQYILNGSAEKNSCNCYTLTKEVTTQSGSVWNSNKINLSNSFDFWFNVKLGCSDAGADGIVFILQPISTSIGSTGEGMGFGGVSPSIGIALDTYQNTNLNDPAFDHISIQANGIINHNSDLAGPVAISSTSDNVEDCNWHKLRITWDAATKWLRTYFNGVLRVESQIDLVTTIFNNDPNVYWGFTGATGGSVNLQQFCTALDPIFISNFSNNITCAGSPVTFTNSSESFAPISSYNWSFGDGTFSTVQNPPPHVYASPGNYFVNLKITGQDGCERDSTKSITVGSIPLATFQVYDTCFKNEPRIEFTPQNFGIAYLWKIDGTVTTGNPTPSILNLSPGLHQLELIASSNYSCGVPDTADLSFTVKPLPAVDAFFSDACVNETVSFSATQTDAATTITQWNWSINNTALIGQNVQYNFTQQGDYDIEVWATATNNCISDTVIKTIKINKAVIAANDTTIISNTATQLHITGNGNFVWTPSTGLSGSSLANPYATLNSDQEYFITVTTAEGCIAEDTMLVKVFLGPAIYVPTAFTPNGDGKNEIFLPVYVGIKELKQFAVFNRWGQRLFQTNNMQKGWDAKRELAGTYVWFINAINHLGQPMILKGTTTIIR